VVQKVATVKRAGADLFIVPSLDYDDAIKHAGKLRIVKADTLDEVLHVLGEQVQGSNALALGRPGAAKPTS
jgi:PDZ domain-containing secreted protein